MLYVKRIIIGLISFVVIFLSTFLVLYATTDLVNDWISDYINSALNEDASVKFKNMRGMLYNEAEFDDLEVVLASGLVIRADYVHARFDLGAIIDGKYHLSYLYTDSLTIDFTDKTQRKENHRASEDKPYFDIYDELKNTEIVVNRLEVRKGRFRFAKNNEGLFDGINFDGHFIFTDDKIDVKVNNLKTEWGEQEDLLLFKTHVTGGPDLVQFNQTEFRYNDSKVIGKVLYKFNEVNDFNIFIDKSNIHSEDIKIITPTLHEQDFIVFNAQINGNQSGFNSNLNIDSAQYQQQDINQTFIESYYNYDKSTLNVFKSSIELNDAHFELNGILFGEQGHQVKIKFERIDLNRFGIKIDHTSLNGEAILDQTELDFSGFSNVLNYLTIQDSKVGNIFIKKSQIQFDNDASGFYLKSGSSIAFDNDSEFELSGNILPESNSMSLVFQTDSAEISALMENFGIKTLKGNVSSSTRVYGKINNPQAFVSVIADSLQLMNDFVVFDANLNMVLGQLASNLNGTARLTSDSVRFAGDIYDEFDILTNLQKDSVNIQNVTLKTDTNGLEFTGKIEFNDSIVNYYVDTFNINYNSYNIANERRLHLNSYKGGIYVNDFMLRIKNGGQLVVDGFYNVDEKTDLNVNLDNILIRPFNQLIGYEHNIDGDIKGKIHINDIEDLSYNLTGNIDGFRIYPKNDTTIFAKINLDTVHFGDLDLRYTYKDGVYDIEKMDMTDNVSDLNLIGRINTAFLFDEDDVNREDVDGLDLDLSFTKVDLNKMNVFIGYYKEFDGLLDGDLKISGTIDDPKGELRVNSKLLNINLLDYSGAVMAKLDKDRIDIENTRIKINETNFDIRGFKLIDLEADNFGDLMAGGFFRFNVKASGDTLTSVNMIIPDIRAIYGDFDADVTISGTFDKPSIKTGMLQLKNARLFLTKLANPITNITTTSLIRDGKMSIDNFVGTTTRQGKKLLGFIGTGNEKGKIIANGIINLNELLHPIMDLDISLDRLYADYHSMNAQVLLSSDNIRVFGRDTLLIRGDISMNEATIYFNLEDQNRQFYESTQSISDRYTIMDFNISMYENIRIYHDDPTSTRSFDMYLRTADGRPMKYYKGTDDKEQLRGIINIESGTFTFLRPFEITKGIVNLDQQDNSQYAFNPKVEFEAEYESDDYFFKVALDDYLTNLSKVNVTVALADNPNSVLPKDNFQIFNLLLYGEEDFNASRDAGETLRSVLNIYASENIDILQEINFDTQSDPNDPESNKNEYAVTFKTKQLQIYESWRVQAIFNSNNQSLFDLIETSVRVFDNLVIYLAREQSSDLTATDTDPQYNLRLQWYYEF